MPDISASALTALRWRLLAANVTLAAAKFQLLLAKANFDPNQPRVPSGNPAGGRWTRVPGSGSARAPGSGSVTQRDNPRVISDASPRNEWDPGAQYAQARPRGGRGGGFYTIGGRLVEVTPGQAARLDISNMQREAAVARVREIEPGWRPTPQAYGTVEGLIAANQANTRQAEMRLLELQRAGIGPGENPDNSIDARSPSRRFTTEERSTINRMGSQTGCHTCGTFEPGTTYGNWIPDHQLPNIINPPGRPQRLYRRA